jgi:hypothetical protein
MQQPKTPKLLVSLTKVQKAYLKKLAVEQTISMASVVRFLIDEHRKKGTHHDHKITGL